MRVFLQPLHHANFLKRYLDEINMHGLPGILHFYRAVNYTFWQKKSKVGVQIGKFRDPENEDLLQS